VSSRGKVKSRERARDPEGGHERVATETEMVIHSEDSEGGHQDLPMPSLPGGRSEALVYL
jgi:hypothetical protein